MWIRLLALALVPLAGIAVVAVPLLRDQVTVADRTRQLDAKVAGLRALVTLQAAITTEMTPTEALLRSAAYGFSTVQASGLLGIDMTERLDTGRVEVDRALDAFEPYDRQRVAEVRATVASWRERFAEGSGSVDVIHAAYERTLNALDADGGARTADIAATAADVAGEVRGVEAATHRLEVAFELSRSGRVQINALFRLLVPGVTADAVVARIELAQATARYDDALATLRNSGAPALAAAATRIADHADDQVVADAVADALRRTGQPVAYLRIAAVFRAGFGRSDRIDDLVRTAAGAATDLAALRRSEAVAHLRDLAVLFSALFSVSALLALGIARSITRRLRPLAARATAINEGALHGPEADETGPREIAVVAHALNETIANLRQLDDQARALARGELDAEVLGTPAPGALGASIHRTFQRLAEAWRDREDLQRRLAHQANHDLLTALPNRKAALEALEAALARAQRHGEAVAVLFVDLDEFKRANDAYGHHAGDRILQLCAERLSATVRAGDLLARLGGDEFVVVSERLGDTRAAVELAERLIAVVTEPFDIDGVTTHVGASVGVGISLDGHATPLGLLREADNAVHRAKRVGKGRVEIFDERARDELEASNALELALRRALAHDELRLHYQPISDTATGRVLGFEALARWTMDGQPVSPADFVAVAEQSDLVNDLGRWALVAATTQLQRWTDDGVHTGAYVAVNISGRHLLHASFLPDVRDALAASGLDPTRLVVEITETVVLNDLASAATVLADLRALGVRVALDDFGTGYTSIGHLWRLPVDLLKIDGAYVRRLGTSQEQVLVELMIEVAHTLGLGLVAEGVETQSQYDALRSLSCDSVQGYHIARPQPPELVLPSDHNGVAGVDGRR